jgi:hypothetical protein
MDKKLEWNPGKGRIRMKSGIGEREELSQKDPIRSPTDCLLVSSYWTLSKMLILFTTYVYVYNILCRWFLNKDYFSLVVKRWEKIIFKLLCSLILLVPVKSRDQYWYWWIFP